MHRRTWRSRLTAGLLARLRGRAEFSVTYEGPELRALTQEVKGWYAGAVPVRLSVPFEGSLDALVASVAGATSSEVRDATDATPATSCCGSRRCGRCRRRCRSHSWSPPTPTWWRRGRRAK